VQSAFVKTVSDWSNSSNSHKPSFKYQSI